MYLQIEEVMLVIPFSRNVRTANLTVTVGTILFDESSKVRKKDHVFLQKKEIIFKIRKMFSRFSLFYPIFLVM